MAEELRLREADGLLGPTRGLSRSGLEGRATGIERGLPGPQQYLR